MKILWFTNTPFLCEGKTGGARGSGGWVSALRDAMKECPDTSLEIAFLSPENGSEEPVVSEGVRYYPIRPFRSRSYAAFRLKRRFMSSERYGRAVCMRMSEIVSDSMPDVIHIHGTEKPFVKAPAEVFCGIPVVCSIQGLVSVCAEKFFSGISESDVRRYSGILSWLMKRSIIAEHKRFVRHALAERRFLGNAAYVIGRTSWDRRITGLLNPAREYFHVDEIMRRPFCTSVWEKSCFSVPFRIVSVMSYGPYKGFETLLRAAALLKEHGRFDFEWTVVGYGASDDYVRISERATGISSSGVNVVFAGKMEADCLASLMCSSDLFCHTSHVDNSPNSVCEAMILGMPVIASSSGGTGSLLDDGREGVLVQDGDHFALAGAICEMQSDFSAAAAMGAAARERALHRNNPEKVCADLLSVYRRVAGK